MNCCGVWGNELFVSECGALEDPLLCRVGGGGCVGWNALLWCGSAVYLFEHRYIQMQSVIKKNILLTYT